MPDREELFPAPCSHGMYSMGYCAVCLKDEITRLRSALASSRAETAALRLVGGQFANAAYNLAQHAGEPLTPPTCDVLHRLRREWDAIPRAAVPAHE